jgi:hypothetical protein
MDTQTISTLSRYVVRALRLSTLLGYGNIISVALIILGGTLLNRLRGPILETDGGEISRR